MEDPTASNKTAPNPSVSPQSNTVPIPPKKPATPKTENPAPIIDVEEIKPEVLAEETLAGPPVKEPEPAIESEPKAPLVETYIEVPVEDESKNAKKRLHKEKKPNKSIKPIMFFVFMGLFLFFSVFLVGGLVAYDFIPFSNENMKISITKAYMSLPFMPANKGFVISQTLMNQANVRTLSIDMTTKMSVPEIQSVLSINNLNVTLNGFLSSNENGLQTDLAVNLSDDFDADIKYFDDMFYMNFRSVPTFFKNYIPEQDRANLSELTNTWISGEQAGIGSDYVGLVNVFMSLSSNPDVSKSLADMFSLSKEKVNDTSMYKLSASLDEDTLKIVNSTLADISAKDGNYYNNKVLGNMKSLSINIWTDKDDLLITQIDLAILLSPEGLNAVGGNLRNWGFPDVNNVTEDIPFELSLSISGYNKDYLLAAPDSTTSFDGYKTMLMRVFVRSNATPELFMNEHDSLTSVFSAVWDAIGTAPRSYYDISSIYPQEPLLNHIVYSDDSDVLIIYGVHPSPEEKDMPIYVSVVSSGDILDTGFYSEDELANLGLTYGVELPLEDILPVTVPRDEQPENADSGDDSGPSTPFGKLLN